MTRRAPGRANESEPVIDIGAALDLLAAAVEQQGVDFVYRPKWMDERTYLIHRYANRGAPDCIVGQALALANLDVRELAVISDGGVRELYLEGKLPVALTLGAMAVFDAAERSQDRGCRLGDVLAHATAAAVKFLDLLPDSAFTTAKHGVDGVSPRSA
ncbi:MAG: hypothetical protein JWP07_627 [Pseudonocardiales bacterium]|nr:hypothetical protein [Pseudonocardiales bacterium]